MMYQFNASLFRILPQVLNVTKRDIAKAADVYPSSINYWGKAEDVPLAKLIAICNHFRIPISYFICPQEETSISISLANFIIDTKDFTPITSTIDTLFDRLTSITPLSIRQVANILGINPQTVINYWKENGTDKMTVRFFVKIINHSHINPNEFVSCHNRPISVLPDYYTLDSINLQSFIVSNLTSLPSHNISTLQLQKENEALNYKVKNLEQRLQELEDLMRYRPMYAAED